MSEALVEAPSRAANIGSVVLKLTSPCNLNCDYCYIYNHEDQGWKRRPKTLSDELLEAFLGRMRAYCERHDHGVSIVLHGGEPLLVGPARLRAIVERIRERLGPRLTYLSVQTNGTLIDDALADLVAELGIGVGVSLDGPRDVHDAARKYHDGRGSHADTLRGLDLLRTRGVEPYVLSVVNPAFDGGECYRYFRSLGLRRFDFLLPDVSWDNKERFYGEYGETPVADFYRGLVDAWLAEDEPDVQVRTAHGLFHALLGGAGTHTDAFGNPAMSYLIVETDGAFEALDALRVCASELSATGLDATHNEIDDLYTIAPELHRNIYTGMPLCATCRACPEVGICGGGYLPHRYSRERGFDNPSVWCADIRALLGYMRARILDASASSD